MWWNEYVGMKFGEKGRTHGCVDCWGLAYVVYKEQLKIELPTYIEYYNSTNDKKVLSDLFRKEEASTTKWVEVQTPEAFDLLVLKVDGMPYHVGIYTHERRFLHCEKGFNTSIAKLDSFRWRKNLVGVFRWAN